MLNIKSRSDTVTPVCYENYAFVCIGLETRFSEIFSKENRNALWAFLSAQTFNIVVTFIVAFLLFGVLKPMWA